MKRFTLILALVLMVAMPSFAEHVTSATAQKAAATFLNNNGAKSTQIINLSKAAGFPNLYIFTTEQSFVVMSADDRVQPILGYSLASNFVAENMPTNVSGWLQGYNDEIQYAIDNNLRASQETVNLWEDLIEGNSKATKATTVVAPLVQTQWDQNGYYYNGTMIELYNNLCPYDYTAGERTVTGCVATAMAQIMKYWGYPSQGIGSHSYTPSTRPDLGVQSANFGATTYQWSNMPNKLSRTSTTTQINAVATLMYHCGVSVNMMYDIGGNGGSGAYSEDIPYALNHYFNYKATANIKYKNDYSTNAWMNLLKTELDAGRPVQYSGSGSAGGHAFICDGYDSSNKFHFNWGWSGSNDGYFELSNLNPGSGGAGGGGYVFNNGQSAIFGIEPASSIPAPTNLAYTLSGLNDITLTWDGVSAASSYNVYCDGNLVGNTTSTTYSETVPFGTHDYYVRCVDANSQLSLPSNTVTVTIAYLTPIVTDLTATLSGNNANLTWTAPEWCYPATPSATLTYGNGVYSGNTLGFNNGSNMYWGHRYLASNLSAYNSMALYKASFYANETGAYKIYVYKGTVSNHPQTKVLEQSLNVESTGWIDFDLSSTIIIDASKDYWVFMYDPEGRSYPATLCSYTGGNGNYYASSPTSWVGTAGDVAFLIKTYVTDGTYTYNLYQDGTQIAEDISQTTYNASLNNNATNLFTIKTNYYGGETEASNKIGFAKGNASLATLSLENNDKMTVTDGSKLIVSGALADVNTNNLILENDAQLVNNSNGVQATVKKNITAYTQDGGWLLIASPITEDITPSTNNGLLANNYDLYTFNQSEELEWRNYVAQSFDINNKVGYLYANSGNPMLVFEGTLAANVTATELVYDNNATLKGFNLIGNPYPCNTYVNRSFYVLTEDGSDFTLGSNPIPPCSAILVQAQGTDESVIFSKNTSKNEPNITIAVTKANTRDNAIIDQARVSFNEKDQLMKYTLSDQNSKLYIPQNGQDFAVAYANEESEMPINFKAAKNGTYTINIETESLELDYLHLIDNMTGADIDLLAMPSYSFEAKTTDYASRFRLVFNANITDSPSTGSGTFAYINDGNIVVNGEGVLQIVDMTGRVIVCTDVACNVSTNEMVPGIYVLRLINGENVMTQKIVIE